MQAMMYPESGFVNVVHFDSFLHFIGKFGMFLYQLKIKDRQSSRQKWSRKISLNFY